MGTIGKSSSLLANKTVTNEHVDKAIAMFNTEAELTSDVQFRKNPQDILTTQWNRPASPEGKRYIRGAWEYFVEHGHFYLQGFLDLNTAIKARTGQKRPMVVREYAKRIMDEAVRRTLVYYAQVEANK